LINQSPRRSRNSYGLTRNLDAGLSIPTTDGAFVFLPFYAIPETGLKRMLDFGKGDGCAFAVNGADFDSTVCDIVGRDIGARGCVILFSNIESNDFRSMLELGRSFDTVLSKDCLTSVNLHYLGE
jgi:hypothetical protein